MSTSQALPGVALLIGLDDGLAKRVARRLGALGVRHRVFDDTGDLVAAATAEVRCAIVAIDASNVKPSSLARLVWRKAPRAPMLFLVELRASSRALDDVMGLTGPALVASPRTAPARLAEWTRAAMQRSDGAAPPLPAPPPRGAPSPPAPPVSAPRPITLDPRPAPVDVLARGATLAALPALESKTALLHDSSTEPPTIPYVVAADPHISTESGAIAVSPDEDKTVATESSMPGALLAELQALRMGESQEGGSGVFTRAARPARPDSAEDTMVDRAPEPPKTRPRGR